METDWNMLTFEEAPLEIIDGDRGSNYPKQADFNSAGYCLFLNAGNVTETGFNFSDCKFISAEKDAKLGKGRLSRNDVIMTTRGTVGNVAYFDESIPYDQIRINSGMVILRAQAEKLLPRYLYLFLRSPFFRMQVASLRTGSAQPQLPIRDMKKIVMPFPSLEEQELISCLLGSLENKIELDQKMNRTLEMIGKTIFKHWFIDFEFPNEEGKPYKSSGGEMVYNKVLQEEIPAWWKIEPFSKVIAVNPKRDLSRGTLARKISMADLSPWQSWIENWSIEHYKSGPKFKNGDILFARITPSLENGKTAFVSILDNDEVGFGSTEFIIFSKKVISSAFYIYHLCRSEIIRSAAISAMSGTSGRQRVPDELFDYLNIILPSDFVVDRFEKICLSLFDRISANAKEVRTLSQIRDSLLPRLLSGKIRVPIEAK